MPPCFFQTAQTAQTATVLYRIHVLPYVFIQKSINQYAFRMNQYGYRAAFSALALGLDALALATLGMLVLDALGVWPVALASGSTGLAALVPGLACDWAGPASRVSARAASAGLLTPLHLM